MKIVRKILNKKNMCEDKKIIAKTLKEFNCYKEFRRNYSNPNLGNCRRSLVQKVLNGEEINALKCTMKNIIDAAFVWSLTLEGGDFWYNLYIKLPDIIIREK